MKEILKQMLEQTRITTGNINKVTAETALLQLSDTSNRIGFIYLHMGEILNLFGSFFGLDSGANTTMGFPDTGQGGDVAISAELIEEGYAKFEKLIEEKTDAYWQEQIDTPFFGRVTRFRLFTHILLHHAYHAGQIGLIMAGYKKST